MLLAKPRKRPVATNGVNCARARGNRPRKIVRESIDRGKQDTQMTPGAISGDGGGGGVVS